MKAIAYRTMVQEFVEGTISAEEFALAYDRAFLKDPGDDFDRPLFNILENLWEDVEAYSPMWTPEEEDPFKITARTLRREAIQTLTELDQYLADSDDRDE